MDINTLKIAINEAITEDEAGKTLTLASDTLRSDAIAQMLNDYLEGEFIVDVTSMADTLESVAIAGISSNGLFTDMAVTAHFTVEDEEATCLITATPLEDWTFVSSFPDLDETFLPLLEFADAKLLLSSYAVAATGEAGLSFQGNLQLTGDLSLVAWLLGDIDQVELIGSIQFHEGMPLLSLAKRLPGITLGFLELPFVQFGVGTVLVPAAEEDQPAELQTGMTFQSEIAFSGTGIPLHTTLFPYSKAAQFAANLTDALNTGLGALASLSNGVDFSGSMPNGFPITEQIALQDFRLAIDLQQRTVKSVQLGVETLKPWVLVENAISIERMRLDLRVDDVMRQKRVAIDFLGEIGLPSSATATDPALLLVRAKYPEFLIFGGLKDGSPSIQLMALLQRLIPGIPGVSDGETGDRLQITTLNFSADTTNKAYLFEGRIDNVWSIPLGFGSPEVTLDIEFLYLFLQKRGREFGVLISGDLALFRKTFRITAERPLGARFWNLSGVLEESDRINLLEIVQQVGGDSSALNSDLTQNLLNIDVYGLGVEIDTSPSKRYAFRGAMDWNIAFPTGETLAVKAKVDIRSRLMSASAPATSTSPKRRLYAGEIGGEVTFTNTDMADVFQYLSVAVAYKFDQTFENNQLATTKDLQFRLTMNQVELLATYRSIPASGSRLAQSLLIIKFGNTTFGDVLNLLVAMVDPSMGEFELDPPWNELGSLSLQGMELAINLTQKDVTFLYVIAGGFNLGFVTIQKIGLKYTRIKGPGGLPTQKKTVEVEIIGRILDKTYSETNPKQWDALNEAPPAVPGQGNAIFDLRFLGVGQHVAFKDVRDFPNITSVMNALKGVPGQPGAIVPVQNKTQNPLDVAELLQFDSKSGWLIGAQFSVIGTLDMSIIFNDPLIYGVRIALSGEKAKSFAGLVFEILYRRISDTVGVYHIELVLPDAMRKLQFGAVAVTLPVVVVDIYTNGDFKLDFGFPWNFNFARSFAIEAFPFTGAGGFYFNKLSAETATSVPIITNGRFNPVIEFGIGLKIGLGKTFNKGVLKAELSITVQGLLEGVIAWFNPTDINKPTDQYYRIQGGVAIVGRLWGMVDFEVIQVEVEVLVRVAVVFVVESYQPIVLALTAEVSVRASIKILFVRIHFSFTLTITQSFTLGSARPTPWVLSPDQSKRQPVRPTGTQAIPAATAQPFTAAPRVAPAMAREVPIAPPTAPTLTTPMARATEAPAAIPGVPPGPTPTAAATSGVPDATAGGRSPHPTTPTGNDEPDTSDRPILDRPAPDETASPLSLEARMVAFSVAEAVDVTPLSWQAVKINLDQPFEQTADQRYAIDLFLQPAVTRDAEGVKGIALLFIENAIALDSSGANTFAADAARNNKDFDTLMQGLLTWAIDAYYVEAGTVGGDRCSIPPGHYPAIALADLEALYAMFIQGDEDEAASFSFTQLMAFLARNFHFRLIAPTQNTSGTLFPMIPALGMKAGNQADRNFDGSGDDQDLLLDPGDIRYFAHYFEQLKGHHGNTVERSTTTEDQNGATAPDPESISVATFVFVDYFGLLVRSALQSAIEYTEDYLKQHPGEGTIKLSDLLQGLNTGGQFNHMAGMASRFLLHGLRLPEWKDAIVNPLSADALRPTLPLYQSIGQQFTLPSPLAAFAMTFRKPAVPTGQPDWITLQPSYPFAENLIALATLMQAATIDPAMFPTASRPTPLPFYTDEPRRFNIRQSYDWVLPDTTIYTLLDLPPELRDFQTTRARNQGTPSLNLALKHGTPPTRPGSILGRTELERTELRPEDIATVRDFFWATKVPLTLRRVVTPDGTALLPATYQMVGTDETGKDLLEDLWQHLAQLGVTPTLILIYGGNERDDAGEKVPRMLTARPVQHVLLKTNLSTYRAGAAPAGGATLLPAAPPPLLFEAHLDEGSAFIQLIWEASTVNTGGFYLYFATEDSQDDPPKGLPDALFRDGLNASLTLLVHLGTTPQPLYGFQNCLVVQRELDLTHSVLYAESTDPGDRIKVSTMPPGHLGFQLRRPLLLPQDDASGLDELQALYQMLGYQVVDPESKSPFTASPEGLPLGPTEDEQPTIHTVAAGETLTQIADRSIDRTHRTAAEIAQLRQERLLQLAADHAAANLLVPGGVLKFGPETTYTVKAGDTLASIAKGQGKAIATLALAAQDLPLVPGIRLEVNTWNYERVLPIYRLAKAAYRHAPDTTQTPALPPQERDPYAGISAGGAIALQFQWQDIYGNRLLPAEKALIQTSPVRYFDRLIGINQWPSVAESYQFKRVSDTSPLVELSIELVFDQSPFIPVPGRPFAETQEKTRTARATYEQVYYQIHQPDVSLTVSTSVIPSWSYPAKPDSNDSAALRQQKEALQHQFKQPFMDFIESAYLYLSTLEHLKALTYPVQDDDTLTTISSAYHVTVPALAEANADIPNLFASEQTLALEYTTVDADTLGSIVRALLVLDGVNPATATPEEVQAKRDHLVQGNQHTPGLMEAGSSVTRTNGTVYLITSEDTFATVAQVTGRTVEALGQAVQDRVAFLVPDRPLQFTYTLQSGDSLRSLEQKIQVVSPHLTLTVAALAAQKATVSLHPTTLTIPERVTVPLELPRTTQIPVGATLASLTAAMNRGTSEIGSISLADVAIANQSVSGLLRPAQPVLPPNVTAAQLNTATTPNLTEEDWQRILDAGIQTRPHETFYTLAEQFAEAVKREAKPNPVVTVADVAVAIAPTTNLLISGQTVIVPPASLVANTTSGTISSPSVLVHRSDADGTPLYPTDRFIFPVTVQIDLSRQEQHVLADSALLQKVPEIRTITAFLSPKTTVLSATEAQAATSPQEQIASLKSFATTFEQAFPDLHLAIGNEVPHKHSRPSADDLVFQPLWAVHLGSRGIQYNIQESMPYFFSPAPLCNTLLAGKAEVNPYQAGILGAVVEKQVEAIDLNVLARDFLVAVEDFLEPAIAIPAAMGNNADQVQTVLQHKETLANAIARQVTHILESQDPQVQERRDIAAERLKQQLLINLVEAYDIETIIQYNVDVDVFGMAADNADWSRDRAPRLSGQPAVLKLMQINEDGTTTLLDRAVANSEFNFTLSSAKIPLSPQGSYLTFFFDTKSPEKLENLRLELVFQSNELEYDITDVPPTKESEDDSTDNTNISQYQASSWLTFILPISSVDPNGCDPATEPNCIGNVDIPIPLRTYPMPPSLVMHRATDDPDNQQQLEDIRQWEYEFVYEHLDIAQDAIEASIEYNAIPPTNESTTSVPTNVKAAQQPLFSALVNFSHAYPQLLPHLQEWAKEKPEVDQGILNGAIASFTTLVGAVANAWMTWPSPSASSADQPVADYTIRESDEQNDANQDTIQQKEITIVRRDRTLPFPSMLVPGFAVDPATVTEEDPDADQITYSFDEKSPEAASRDPIYGESSIPDRILSVPNLDIIHQQNAWASVWITRNRDLIRTRQADGTPNPTEFMVTRPAFVFQTPAVRFSNLITPFLVNNRRWDIALIGAPDGITPQHRLLKDHLQTLFTTLLPNPSEDSTLPLKAYDFRVACRYAFALSTANGLGQDLLSTLPVLLSPRFSVGKDQNPTDATKDLQQDLDTDMKQWFKDHRPNPTNASFILSVSIFSNPSEASAGDTVNLPLLRIEHLGLQLSTMTDPEFGPDFD